MTAITFPTKMTLVLRKSRPHKRLRLFKKGAVNRRRDGGGGGGGGKSKNTEQLSTTNIFLVLARIVLPLSLEDPSARDR